MTLLKVTACEACLCCLQAAVWQFCRRAYTTEQSIMKKRQGSGSPPARTGKQIMLRKAGTRVQRRGPLRFQKLATCTQDMNSCTQDMKRAQRVRACVSDQNRARVSSNSAEAGLRLACKIAEREAQAARLHDERNGTVHAVPAHMRTCVMAQFMPCLREQQSSHGAHVA